jgi:hypothetical protein
MAQEKANAADPLTGSSEQAITTAGTSQSSINDRANLSRAAWRTRIWAAVLRRCTDLIYHTVQNEIR